jgi:proteasome lid subunit RPN8/RPN11
MGRRFVAALTDPIYIHHTHWTQMLEHVSSLEPEEACGLAVGKDHLVTRIYPIENILHSPVSFRMQPQQQVDAILEMEQAGCDLMVIYHSHPAGPPVPSSTDIALATFPDAVNLIWSKQNGLWICRGFLIQVQESVEVPIFHDKSQ